MEFSELSSEEKRAFWKETAEATRVLVEEMGEGLSSEDRRAIFEYLQHNELGLALEHLCDTLVEEGMRVTEGQYQRLARQFERTGLATDRLLRVLR